MSESAKSISAIYGPFSSPLGVLTQRLATGKIVCRDSFAGVLSDLRSRGSVGNPAGPAVVRTCAGDRGVIYDTFYTPGSYMPPTGFVPIAHDTHVQYF